MQYPCYTKSPDYFLHVAGSGIMSVLSVVFGWFIIAVFVAVPQYTHAASLSWSHTVASYTYIGDLYADATSLYMVRKQNPRFFGDPCLLTSQCSAYMEKRTKDTGLVVFAQPVSVADSTWFTRADGDVTIGPEGFFIAMRYDLPSNDTQTIIQRRSLADGGLIWERWDNIYGAAGRPGGEIVYDMQIDNGYLYAAGHADNGSVIRGFVRKHDIATGNVLWQQVHGSGSISRYVSVAVDSAGVYVGGLTDYTLLCVFCATPAVSRSVLERRNVTTGAEVWRLTRGALSDYQEVSDVHLIGSGLYAVRQILPSNFVESVSPASGAELWSDNLGSVLYAKKRILTAPGQSLGLVFTDSTGGYTTRVQVRDVGTGVLLSSDTTRGNGFWLIAPIVSDSILYTTSGSGGSAYIDKWSANLPQPGVCGASNGGGYPVAPSIDLCNVGAVSWTDNVGGDGSYNWTCVGVNGGADASCAAVRLMPTNGVCGTSNAGSFLVAPAVNLCAPGTLAWVDSIGADGSFNWNCGGLNGGSNAVCAATRLMPVNGSCGISNGGSFVAAPALNLCVTGTTAWTDNVGTDGSFNWNCNGLNGGSNVVCAATRQVLVPQ